MAEPVSAIITIVVFAFDTSKKLYEAVSSFKDERKTVKDFLEDLHSLITVLEILQRLQGQDAQAQALEDLRTPLRCCTETCQELKEKLAECTKDSKDGKSSIRSWLRMQYQAGKFDDMKKRLASYKSTLTIAFQLMNLQSSESLQDLKKQIEGTKDELLDQLEDAREAILRADEASRILLQEDLTRLQSSLDSLAQSQKLAEAERPTIIIKSNKAGEGARAIYGTDNTQPSFNLNVSENIADAGATMSAGVHSPATLQALLRESRTPNLALALQALSSLPATVQGNAICTMVNGLAIEANNMIPQTSRQTLLTDIESVDSEYEEPGSRLQDSERVQMHI